MKSIDLKLILYRTAVVLGGILFYWSLWYTVMYHNTYTAMLLIANIIVTTTWAYMTEIRPNWVKKLFPGLKCRDKKLLSPKEAIIFGAFAYIIIVLIPIALVLFSAISWIVTKHSAKKRLAILKKKRSGV